MPEHRPTGPILKIGTPVVLLIWTGVIIGAFWGLDWRWIPTTFLASVALLLVGALVEVQLDRRAEQRAAEQLRDGWSVAPTGHVLDAMLGKNEPR